jgi:hypothetical protein
MTRMSSAPKKRITRSLAELVPNAMGEALAAQGFAGGEIVLRWREIAGPDLARRSEPVKLTWPRQPKGKDAHAQRLPAALLIQVESAFALELQMQAPVLLERINRYFGWNCVSSIKFKQGPVGTRKPAAKPERPLSAEAESQLNAIVSEIEDDKLADALLRLGRAVKGAAAR